MVTELMTLGALLTLFRGSPSSVRKQIAGRFGTTDKVFDSWLGALTAVRNICAHHGRLWNRVLGYKPMIPKKAAQWHEPVEVSNTRVFGVLTILKYLLSDITRDTQWPTRLSGLLAEYPEIPLDSMGFPEDWRLCPLWVERD
jgi:abortive infection bacteriophage resistance protein